MNQIKSFFSFMICVIIVLFFGWGMTVFVSQVKEGWSEGWEEGWEEDRKSRAPRALQYTPRELTPPSQRDRLKFHVGEEPSKQVLTIHTDGRVEGNILEAIESLEKLRKGKYPPPPESMEVLDALKTLWNATQSKPYPEDKSPIVELAPPETVKLSDYDIFFALLGAQETHVYQVVVDRVVDGDTIHGTAILPWGHFYKPPNGWRAKNFDTWERRDFDKWKAAKESIEEIGIEFVATGNGPPRVDSFGRPLVYFLNYEEDGDRLVDIRPEMTDRGHIKVEDDNDQ